ncbi:nidogen [Vanessa atalanta]|uniref:nidogen n=1 Tax=Vanessa atalanta TaxID=42275 RepID=UPI001FCDAF8F|nr:nidogen [Vanessa atalanta]
MWTGGLVLLLVGCACAITRDQFYPHGQGLDQRLPRGAEVSSPEIPLNVPIVFFGETYENIFVNNYGVLSFRADIPTFLNAEFPLPYPSIAAFYANIDTTQSGEVYYRETNESHVLVKAEESVQNNFHDYYDFRPTSVFIASWIDVTYASKQWQDRKNSFQIAIISNGTESFVEMLYPEREIQWIQKETQPGSMPDAKAQAGFIAEDGRLFTLRGSGSHQIRNVVSWSNTREPGKYVFRVGNITIDGTVAVPDQYDQNEVEVEEETRTCAQSGPSVCHLQARCVDYQTGICCQCSEGFYGNGKSCIKDDVPLRVHGKLNGIINDVNLNDVDIQAYVVVADGRTYTALSQAPPLLGSSLQLLTVLGGVLGWLFAKPSGTAKNGYQLTGGLFNHTADIYFPDSKDRVTINQEYIGHDVFDQITLDADIRGTIPIVSSGSRLEISEYNEEYTVVEAGLIHSVSSRTFTNKITGQKYEQRVSQTFSYNPCRYAPPTEENEISTLKVIKNYLGYETRENIVRYSTSNKIQPRGQEDPCIEGRNSCGTHSTCVVQGDSFTCVCQSGFTSIYYEDSHICVDIDECAASTHNCDSNADCYNHDGGFQCRCRDGYEGNGISCNIVSRCRDKVCDPHAQCIDNPGEEPICSCKPGFTGDGQRCWQTLNNICSRCSPYAYCSYSDQINSYQCQCNPGFSGDGEYCVEDTTSIPDVTETTEISVAPLQSTTAVISEVEYNETYVLPNCEIINDDYECFCPPGYSRYKDERNNDLCRIDTYKEPKNTSIVEENNDTSITCSIDSECPPNAICSFSGQQSQGHCVCPEGYEGDAYECIERTGSSCSCGPSAHCIDTATGEMMCVCDLGYHGDGYVCRPNFSCTNNSDCEYNAECRPDPNTDEFVCQCIEGYIKDQNDACIPDGQLCNGAVCAEHASCLYDETLEVNYCSCDEGFEGEGISKCVPLGKTCDVANDCSPNAICTTTEASYQCICREGYFGDGYTCNAEMNCRTNIYLCDSHASCLKTSEGYECECNTGYNGNGTYCEINPRQSGNFLVASDGASVYRVPFKVTPREFATPLNSAIYQIAVGIDVDCLTGRIYWGDVGASAIKRTSYDGSNFEQFLSYDIQSPEGMSVDWTSRNIFWTDSKKLTIEVANLDTKVKKVLFKRDGIFNPRGIAVHPGKGKIFWTDWNRNGPKIEWANMDGSQRGVFLDKSEVKLPNSLAIDWSRDRLCFTDAGLYTIKCVSIDTLESETIVANCSYPFGLAISGDSYYWTDWKTLKIEYINNLTLQRGQVPIATASRRLYGVTVAPEQCPNQSNICQYRNGQCDPNQICLPDGKGGRTCAAGDNYSY